MFIYSTVCVFGYSITDFNVIKRLEYSTNKQHGPMLAIYLDILLYKTNTNDCHQTIKRTESTEQLLIGIYVQHSVSMLQNSWNIIPTNNINSWCAHTCDTFYYCFVPKSNTNALIYISQSEHTFITPYSVRLTFVHATSHFCFNMDKKGKKIKNSQSTTVLNTNESVKKNRSASKSRSKNVGETLVVVHTEASTSSNNSIDKTPKARKSLPKKNDISVRRIECDSEIIDAIDLDSSNDESIDQNVSETIENNIENDIENTSENILFEKYFRIVEDKNNAKRNIAASCLTCEKEKKFQVIVRGSLLATSNFIRHLRVIFLH